MKRTTLAARLLLGLALSGAWGGAARAQNADSPYLPTTESLRRHKAPQWYDDAKFGIFIHWGPYAVPAYHEWYLEFISPKSHYGFMLGGPPFTAERGDLPEALYRRRVREDAVRYHIKNYGADFNYDRFLPMFTAEKFDPAAWAKLFQEAGAKYVVLTAKHGDEFAMWPSKYTHRNAMETGPHRDVAGDLTKEVRRLGLKMGFYHNTTYTFYDARYPGRDWVEYMNNSIKELVDRYQPSVLWGDVIEGPVLDGDGKALPAGYWGAKQVLAYFYNHSAHPDEVVANDRWGKDVDGKMMGDFATPERTRMRGVSKQKWESCDSLDPTSWGYNRRLEDWQYMKPNELVDYLVDVVSKNGNLLINIGPRADGTIPEVMARTLRETGDWLRVNGEAIYGSHYWDKTYQEGDVRFTRKGNTLYAIALEWPEGDLVLGSLKGRKVESVRMLGMDADVKWTQGGAGLVITPPAKRPCRYAYTFRIEVKSLTAR